MSDNLYGGASIQIYPGGEATLSTPHSDVKAFLEYVGQFNPVNFHAMDDDVREWRYNHEFDNWQDRLGMDSVKVFYHHEHSGMAADGRFVAGMGRTWDDTLQADSSRSPSAINACAISSSMAATRCRCISARIPSGPGPSPTRVRG